MSRRSIYLLNKRTVRLPLMANFDQPDTMSSCAMRPVSTHALQALTLMNSDFMTQQSAAFAKRLKRRPADRSGEGSRAYELALPEHRSKAESHSRKRFFRKGGNFPSSASRC